MIGRKKIDLRMINPSSKIALKISCLQSCNGDIEKANKLYNFLAEGVDTIPDFDTPQPTFMQQASQTAGSVFGWVKENQNDIIQAWNFFQTMRNGGTIPAPGAPAPQPEIPPLPEMGN